MANANRPLSPHLQIYKLPLTAWISITFQRATGVALYLGSFLLTYWLFALANGPEAFATAQSIIGSAIGQIIMIGFTVAFFTHFCNGIRHLFWDAGFGFDLKSVALANKLVIAASLALTVITWLIVWS